MFTTCLLFAAALTADPVASAGADPTIQVKIASIEDQSVPGSDAGVLMTMAVKEGSMVKKGDEIGRVDDSEAQANLHVKKLEYDVANQTAESTVEIKYAEANAKVSKAALDKLRESNKAFAGTVTAIDILRSELELERAVLGIEQASEKKKEAQLTAKAKYAEWGVANVALERRKLKAPFDGMIVMVTKKPGEWVAPGEPVVQIVGINRLRAKGDLDAAQWSPVDIEGKEVTVEVALPRGRTVKVPGQITFVSPVVDIGRMEVWAEITPQMEGGLPVVRAGMNGSMTIHASRPAKRAAPSATTSKPSATTGARSPAAAGTPVKPSSAVAPVGTKPGPALVPARTTPARTTAPVRTTPTRSTGKN